MEKTITRCEPTAITRAINLAYEKRIGTGKPSVIIADGLYCRYISDVQKVDEKFRKHIQTWNAENYDVTSRELGPGVDTEFGIYEVKDISKMENEIASKNEETIRLSYFDTNFISSLVKKAYKKAKAKKKDILNPYTVTAEGLSCHIVKDIKENDATIVAAVHIWNLSQDGCRRMVVGKGLKEKRAIYVVYSDRYLDNLASFWKLCK